MKLYVFDFMGSYTGGSLVVIAESEKQVIELYDAAYRQEYLSRNNPEYIDTRPTAIHHSQKSYKDDYKNRSDLLLVESFDVPDRTARIITDSYHCA